MAEPTIIHRLFALKEELERLGCQVTITGLSKPVITVSIVYPPDVPAPALPADEVKP